MTLRASRAGGVISAFRRCVSKHHLPFLNQPLPVFGSINSHSVHSKQIPPLAVVPRNVFAGKDSNRQKCWLVRRLGPLLRWCGG